MHEKKIRSSYTKIHHRNYTIALDLRIITLYQRTYGMKSDQLSQQRRLQRRVGRIDAGGWTEWVCKKPSGWERRRRRAVSGKTASNCLVSDSFQSGAIPLVSALYSAFIEVSRAKLRNNVPSQSHPKRSMLKCFWRANRFVTLASARYAKKRPPHPNAIEATDRIPLIFLSTYRLFFAHSRLTFQWQFYSGERYKTNRNC